MAVRIAVWSLGEDVAGFSCRNFHARPGTLAGHRPHIALISISSPRRAGVLHSVFPHVLEIATPNYTRKEAPRQHPKNRSSRLSLSCPDCWRLGNRFLPGHPTAICGNQKYGTIQSWLTKHPVCCSVLKRMHDEHVYTENAFESLADYRVLVGRDATGHPVKRPKFF